MKAPSNDTPDGLNATAANESHEGFRFGGTYKNTPYQPGWPEEAIKRELERAIEAVLKDIHNK